MMALVEHVRTSDPTSLRAPTFVLYSIEDQVVDAFETTRFVSEMREDVVSTIQYGESDDPDSHIHAGDIVAPGSTDYALHWILRFVRQEVAPIGVAEAP